MKLNEKAEAYIPVEFKNISEFKKIPTDIETFEKETTYKEGDEPKVEDYIKLMDEDQGKEIDVKVPKTVLGQLKVQLEANKNIKNFSVVKEGEGNKTKYTVIPIME